MRSALLRILMPTPPALQQMTSSEIGCGLVVDARGERARQGGSDPEPTPSATRISAAGTCEPREHMREMAETGGWTGFGIRIASASRPVHGVMASAHGGDDQRLAAGPGDAQDIIGI